MDELISATWPQMLSWAKTHQPQSFAQMVTAAAVLAREQFGPEYTVCVHAPHRPVAAILRGHDMEVDIDFVEPSALLAATDVAKGAVDMVALEPFLIPMERGVPLVGMPGMAELVAAG